MRYTKAVIKKEALEVFEFEIQKVGSLETGGVLVGFIENDIITICKASPPGPKANHEEIFFRADADYVDMFIDMEYANSEGKHAYLGEWHTHPQIKPHPSPIDLHSLDEITATSNSDFVILLIIGASNYSEELFEEQSILITKYQQNDDFYELNLEFFDS